MPFVSTAAQIGTSLPKLVGTFKGLFGGEADIAAQLPKLFYLYTDEHPVARRSWFLTENGRYIGTQSQAWAYLKTKRKDIVNALKAWEGGTTLKNEARPWQYLKHMVVNGQDGSFAGFQGFETRGGITYDGGRAQSAATTGAGYQEASPTKKPTGNKNTGLIGLAAIAAAIYFFGS